MFTSHVPFEQVTSANLSPYFEDGSNLMETSAHVYEEIGVKEDIGVYEDVGDSNVNVKSESISIYMMNGSRRRGAR